MMVLAKIHIWQWEALTVAVVLATVVYLAGDVGREWIGAAAVFFTFMHAQIAEQMAEQQAEMAKPSVECWPWLQRYFYTKEVLWLAYFMLSHTWSALVGVFLFLAYPIWRKYYLSRSEKHV